MQLYCPSCKIASQASERCARCGDRLITPSEVAAVTRGSSAPEPELFRPTLFGRVFAGTATALGLYYASREVYAGLLMVVEQPEFLQSLPGVLSVWCLKLIAVVTGSLLAGAGRSPGGVAGFLTTLVSCALFWCADRFLNVKLNSTDLGALTGLAFVGIPMGILGSRKWPAAVALPKSLTGSRGSSLIRTAQEEARDRPAPPTAWFQLLVGILIGVIGFYLADTLRMQVKVIGGSNINLGPPAFAPVIDIVFAIITLLFSGVLAAAGTGAGLRHGAWLGGVVGGLICLGLVMGKEMIVPTIEGLLLLFGLGDESLKSTQSLTAVFLLCLFVGSIGGVFGATLLPKLARKRKKKGYLDS
jgi:hypothetical protein